MALRPTKIRDHAQCCYGSEGRDLALIEEVVRQYVDPVRSTAAAQRKQLVSLRKQLQQLQRQVALLQRSAERRPALAEDNDDARKLRFSSKGLQSLGKRLDLSAEEFGKLVQVSGKTVYGWEGGASPRAKYLPAIAALRKIGKREARARLEQINAG